MSIKIFNSGSQVFIKENDKIIGNIKRLELILTVKHIHASRLYLTFVDGKQRVCSTEEIQQINLDSTKGYSIVKIDKEIAIKYNHQNLGLIQEAKFVKDIDSEIPTLELDIAFLF